MTRTIRLLAAGLVLTAATLLAACGSSDPAPSESDQGTTTTEAMTDDTMEEKDGSMTDDTMEEKDGSMTDDTMEEKDGSMTDDTMTEDGTSEES